MPNNPNNTVVSRHVLSVLVEDLDGIISRVSAMFTRRGFSLVSLVSGKTEHPKINRITVVVDADEVNIEQITKQLNKLVPVLKVVRLEEGTMVARALLEVLEPFGIRELISSGQIALNRGPKTMAPSVR